MTAPKVFRAEDFPIKNGIEPYSSISAEDARWVMFGCRKQVASDLKHANARLAPLTEALERLRLMKLTNGHPEDFRHTTHALLAAWERLRPGGEG